MDTSETYIEMCEKAEEIQKLRSQRYSHLPDLFYSRRRTIDCTVCEGNDSDQHPIWNSDSQYCSKCGSKLTESFDWVIATGNYGPLVSVENHIWLPRQDQLQEMLECHGRVGKLLYAFHYWAFRINDFSQYFHEGKRNMEVTTCPFTSMEQLWLAFAMKEKYGKVWSGEEWIKES